MLDATRDYLRNARHTWAVRVEDAWITDRWDDLDINNKEAAAPPTRLLGLAAIDFMKDVLLILKCDLRGHRYVADLTDQENGRWEINCECCGHSQGGWMT